MVRYPEEWPWSSYRATAGLVDAPSFLAIDWLLGVFGSIRREAVGAYRRFVEEGADASSLWGEVKNQIYLGSEGFVVKMQAMIEPDRLLREVPQKQRRVVARLLAFFSEQYADRKEAMGNAIARALTVCRRLQTILALGA